MELEYKKSITSEQILSDQYFYTLKGISSDFCYICGYTPLNKQKGNKAEGTLGVGVGSI